MVNPLAHLVDQRGRRLLDSADDANDSSAREEEQSEDLKDAKCEVFDHTGVAMVRLEAALRDHPVPRL
jgi:hypothetical protein